jgi:hypothetical protein
VTGQTMPAPSGTTGINNRTTSPNTNSSGC